MASTRKVIELFYDVVSPYNWFAFEVLCRYRSVWNMDLKLRPAFLSGILHGSGNTTPSLLPRKCSYMRKEMARLEPYFRVPILIPNDPIGSMVKKGSLSAMRFITAVDESRDGGQAEVENVSRELWKRIWGHDEDITLPASLSEAGLKAGLSPYEIEKLLRLASSKKIKDKLKSTTQEALDYGAFGLPFMICHVKGQKEAFFGSDRFEIMAQCIGDYVDILCVTARLEFAPCFQIYHTVLKLATKYPLAIDVLKTFKEVKYTFAPHMYYGIGLCKHLKQYIF